MTTAFVVLGVGAYTVRRGQSLAEGRLMLRLALWFLAIFVPLQIVLGDAHGLNTLEYQPAKLAAIEGLWDGGSGVPASIIGWPDSGGGDAISPRSPSRNSAASISPIPGTARSKASRIFPPDQRAPVAVVYFASASWSASAC